MRPSLAMELNSAFRTSLPLVLLLLTFSALSHAQSGCFWPNGTENPSESYRPCSNDINNPLHAICCASWDTCLPNGICRGGIDDDGNSTWWRETCIFDDWTNGGCMDICAQDVTSKGSDINVTPCDGTDKSSRWCCGKTKDCCDGSAGDVVFTIAEFFGDPIPTIVPSSSSGSATSSPTTTPPSSSTTSGASASASNSQENSGGGGGGGGLSTGAKAGIGVGAAIAGAVIVIIAVILIRRANKKRKLEDQPYATQGGYQSPDPPSSGMQNDWRTHQKPTGPIYEAQGSEPQMLGDR